MSWTPREKEIAAMLAADGKHRYEYFIHRVCDTQRIWGLYSEGWASLGDGEQKLMPLWPHQVYAERFKIEEWNNYAPREINLRVFLDKWVQGMKDDGVQPAIFPVGSGSSIVVSLNDLEANLRYELAKHGETD